MNEELSALVDGELQEGQLARHLTNLRDNGEQRAAWDTCHLIGDALRGHIAPEICSRVAIRLAEEPTVLAPRLRWRKPVKLALSAAASLAAVAVVLTLVIFDNPLQPGSQVAVAPKPAITESTQAAARPQPVATANQGRMNEYLMAHQEFSPSTALQGVAPYVRTVSVAHGVDGR